MTNEDKKLVLKDLCTRLPYNVKVLYSYKNKTQIRELGLGTLHDFIFNNVKVIPYLRPLSSMSDEERKEYLHIALCDIADCEAWNEVDWLNAHHFDYRELIPRGLAIEVTEEIMTLKGTL